MMNLKILSKGDAGRVLFVYTFLPENFMNNNECLILMYIY